mgnify:CR=1 FL=1
MDARQFEQAVLHMVYAGGHQRLTPVSVAYHLGLPVKTAERELDRLVGDGTLELDSDDEGNLFYFVPGSAAAPGAPPPNLPATPPHAGHGWPPPPAPASYYPPPPHAGYPHPPSPHTYTPPQAYGANQPHPPSGGSWSPPHGQAAPPSAWGAPAPGMGGQGYANMHPGSAITPYQRSAAPAGRGEDLHSRQPAAAAVLSIVPGAGQLYNGQIFRSFGLFLATMTLYSILPPLGMVLHGYAMLDAYQSAKRTQPQGLLPP